MNCLDLATIDLWAEFARGVDMAVDQFAAGVGLERIVEQTLAGCEGRIS